MLDSIIYNYPNGQKMFEFQCVNGLKHGSSQSWHENGRLAILSHWHCGQLHGPISAWHANGMIHYQGVFDHGKKVGNWTEWDQRGQILEEAVFLDDLQI